MPLPEQALRVITGVIKTPPKPVGCNKIEQVTRRGKSLRLLGFLGGAGFREGRDLG